MKTIKEAAAILTSNSDKFNYVQNGVFTSKEKKVYVFNVTKKGTKREFFAVSNPEGLLLSSTMFARKYDAMKVVDRYLSN